MWKQIQMTKEFGKKEHVYDIGHRMDTMLQHLAIPTYKRQTLNSITFILEKVRKI